MTQGSLHKRFATLAACVALGLEMGRKKTMSRLIVAALLLTSFTVQAQPVQPAMSFKESERIWRADFEKRREEKLQADEKSLREVLEKINQLAATNEFSIQSIEKLFGLELQHTQTLESSESKYYKSRDIYIAKNAGYPFTTNCPGLGNIDFEFRSKYWLQVINFGDEGKKQYILALYHSDAVWIDLQDRFMTTLKKVIRAPEWRISTFGPNGTEKQNNWRRETESHFYSFSFLRASDFCKALHIQFGEKP